MIFPIGREGLSTLARKLQDLGVTLSFQSAKQVPVYESMLKGCSKLVSSEGGHLQR